MIDGAWHTQTAAVARHPAIAELGRDATEQRRVEAFARDLSAWLVGAPAEDLAPLPRVVTALGGVPLRDARLLCRGLPLLAIEAGARATAELWPWLAEALAAEPPEPPPPEDGEGEDGGSGEGDEGEDEGDEDEGEDDAEDGVASLLAALSGGDADDPDVDRLAARLAEAEDPAEAALEALGPVGDRAFEGAQEAEGLARQLEALVPQVGWSDAPGRLQATLVTKLDALVELLDKLPALRRIADALGRMEEGAARSGHQGGGEEVTGVHLGGEVRSALPSELALLATEDTEDLFYQRLVEHRLVSLELSGAGVHGVGAERRGPVLACIDTSGSMAGAPEAAAKALVLATCRRVLPQGRVVHLLLFGGRDEATELRLKRGRGGLEHLLDFLALSFDGGTDFDTPLARALELLDEADLSKADVLVVTDGHARASKRIVEDVAEARRRRGVRVWSVVLGSGRTDGVAPFSDEVWTLGLNGEGEAALTKITH